MTKPPPRIWPVVLAALAGIAILASLGVWQLQRLQWKQGLLAELAAKAQADPVSLAEAEAMNAQGGDIEFVKVKFRANFDNDATMKMISVFDGGPGWIILTPAITSDGKAVIVDRGGVPADRLDQIEKPNGEVELTGVIRTHAAGRGYFDPDNDPKGNLWYWWDLPAMLKASGLGAGQAPEHFVVQLLPDARPGEFPRPPEPKADLRNNHLGYAITWFGLALALLAITFIYIRSLRKPPAA